MNKGMSVLKKNEIKLRLLFVSYNFFFERENKRNQPNKTGEKKFVEN